LLNYLTSWSLILSGLLLSIVFMIVPVIQYINLVLRGMLLGVKPQKIKADLWCVMQVVQLQGFSLKLKRERKVTTSMLRDGH